MIGWIFRVGYWIFDSPRPSIPGAHPGRARPPAEPLHTSPTRAFTLVEIALAMLAFSLGILSFFALLSLSLNQGLDAQHQTRAAEFADSTLRGLRAVSDHLSETAVSNEWSRFWNDVRLERTNIIVTAGGTNSVWHNAPVIWGNNSDRTVVFMNHPLRAETYASGGDRDDSAVIANHTLRYRMLVDLHQTSANWPHDTLAIVTLRVWEGATGRSADNEALIFFTQFTDRGAVR